VSLESWGQEQSQAAGSARRWIGPYAASFVVVGAVLVLTALFGSRIKQHVLEQEVEVKLVAPLVEPTPPTPPSPAPPPPKSMPVVRRPTAKVVSVGEPPPAKREAAPTTIPNSPPQEADPSRAVAEVAYDPNGDPNGCLGCSGKGRGSGADGMAGPSTDTDPAKPPAPLYQVSETTIAPIALSKVMPAYPPEARKEAIDAVVVVRFVVTEDGQVADIEVVDGHPLLDHVVTEALKKWRFRPGLISGKVARVARQLRFPFHVRTSQ